MVSVTDEQLIVEYLEGAQESFDLLLERYLKAIYNFIFRMIGDPKEAEDLSQETFLKVWTNLKKFKRNKRFKVWIYQIARHTTIDFIRKKKTIPFSDLSYSNDEDNEKNFEDSLKDDGFSPLENMEKLELENTVQSVLNELPPYYKDVIIFHYLEQLTFDEISQITGESLNTLKSRHRRALVVLKKKFADGKKR